MLRRAIPHRYPESGSSLPNVSRWWDESDPSPGGRRRGQRSGYVHDDPLQKVVAAAMRADLLAQRLRDPDRAREATAIQETLRDAIEQLRQLLMGLRPPAFDTRGLADAIRQHADDAGIVRVRVRDRLTSEPPEGLRLILYRIAQEVLTNVRKHAGASNVDVVLEERDEGCYVRIADDGVGFSVEETAGKLRGHLGLVEIRERAEVAGGWCSVRSLPGDGTVVEFWVPLRTSVATATVFDVSDEDGADAPSPPDADVPVARWPAPVADGERSASAVG